MTLDSTKPGILSSLHTTPASSSWVQSLFPQPRDLQCSMLFSLPLHITLSNQIFPGQETDCQQAVGEVNRSLSLGLDCKTPGLDQLTSPGLEKLPFLGLDLLHFCWSRTCTLSRSGPYILFWSGPTTFCSLYQQPSSGLDQSYISVIEQLPSPSLDQLPS